MRANHLVGSILLRAALSAGSRAHGSAADQPEDPWVAKALAYLDGMPPPASAGAWAAAVGLHRNRFSERFQSAMGMPPAAYLRSLRIQRAEKWLLSGEASLERIAIEAGFRDVRSMGHAFAASHGCSPSAWRRAHTGRGS
jgi:transcriptional regulator GlxA family with amidase domain